MFHNKSYYDILPNSYINLIYEIKIEINIRYTIR